VNLGGLIASSDWRCTNVRSSTRWTADRRDVFTLGCARNRLGIGVATAADLAGFSMSDFLAGLAPAATIAARTRSAWPMH